MKMENNWTPCQREKIRVEAGTLEGNTDGCKDVGFYSEGDGLPVACKERRASLDFIGLLSLPA